MLYTTSMVLSVFDKKRKNGVKVYLCLILLVGVNFPINLLYRMCYNFIYLES